jgi:tetratricopeptide (TPR) repeat protein
MSPSLSMPDTTVAQVLPHVSEALERRDVARAFELLAPYSSQVTEQRDLALTWLTLLRIAPSHASLVADTSRILARWPEDPELVMNACDALIRAAELQGPDVLPDGDGAAQQAAAAAERCLKNLSAAQRGDARLGGYLSMNRANALRLAHRYADAAEAFRDALATDAKNGDWWFNQGLMHKAAGDFEACLSDNQRARELVGDEKRVLWNIAISATALGKGEIAAEAMRKLGFDASVQPSGMPFVADMPPMQVRVATIGSGHGMMGADLDRSVAFELVWVSPASPCHGVVQTATSREGSADYGDLVLWDGTPVGVFEHEGRRVPRFPLLHVLRKGDEHRFRFVALEQDQGDVLAFGQELPQEATLFAHHARIEMLCSRCATGDHMRKHEHLKAEPHRLVYGKMIIPRSADLPAFQLALRQRLAEHSKVQLVMPGLLEALGETAAAGKAHQLWRGLERTAEKGGRASGLARRSH